ncbi:PilN domain-containing protein [Bacillus sp. UNC41MFS5]|uniref:PilN domain-containing protein n=1 Tax=Bacillus sp. UNC41MFS5 TaxID=1449046 RepID=UPI00068D7164|nr:PilN domain-containing protein [Bacillus sp. UNC41MFS5]
MLVEINLLPQKEPKKIGFIITLSSLTTLLLLIGAFYFWQTNDAKNEIATIARQITMTKKIADNENKSTEAAAATSSVSQLKSAIEWANEYPIQTLPVMRHLTSLLPERGFIQSFAYTEAGTISLTVQFDSAREAAYFLDNLNESKWIEESSLSSLSAAATEESTADNSTTATTSQSNSTNSTTQTTTQTNQSDTNQNGTNQNSSIDTSSQTNSTSGTTGEQTNTTISTSNTNTTNNSTTASSSTTSKKEKDNILPRYTGQFEIKLNKEVVKKNIKKSKNNDEGVTGS